MNVVIVGAGSVGMLLTYYFTKHRISPTLVTNRVEQASALHNKGLHLTYVDELSEDVSISAIPFSKLHTVKQIDLLIIAVKSYDVHKVLAGLNVNTVQAILFVQNGMSHTTLFDHIQIDEIGVASIEHGAKRINDYTVCHTGIGAIRWGYVQRKTNIIETTFSFIQDPKFPFYYEQDWKKMLERKLVINACINPLTALLRVKNGELLTSSDYIRKMKAIFNEAIQVVHTKHPKALWQDVCNVCKTTAENYSSMYVDVNEGAQTEVETILGYIVKEGKRKNIHMPVISTLYEKIKLKET